MRTGGTANGCSLGDGDVGLAQALVCEKCRYCHRWADKTVKIDAAWKARMQEIYKDLLKDIDGGSFWDPYHKTLEEAPDAARRFVGMMKG